NRHKKSITLDLKKPQAREIVYGLVAKSDVFVQNFRKGVAGRLGLDYPTLSRHNPKLIYASASGYGPLGPDSGEPSFDYLDLACRAILGKAFKRMPRAAVKSALWNHYCCADGKWIALAMAQQDRYWTDFCSVLGISEVTSDPRFATIADRAENARELVAILDRAFASRPRDEWLKAFRTGGDFIYAPVNSVADLPDDP